MSILHRFGAFVNGLYNEVQSGIILDIMAPRSRDTRLRLGEPFATDLAAFRATVGLGNTEIGVVREAVRFYIAARISEDEELRKRYEAEREKLIAAKLRPLRLIKNGSEPTE